MSRVSWRILEGLTLPWQSGKFWGGSGEVLGCSGVVLGWFWLGSGKFWAGSGVVQGWFWGDAGCFLVVLGVSGRSGVVLGGSVWFWGGSGWFWGGSEVVLGWFWVVLEWFWVVLGVFWLGSGWLWDGSGVVLRKCTRRCALHTDSDGRNSLMSALGQKNSWED